MQPSMRNLSSKQGEFTPATFGMHERKQRMNIANVTVSHESQAHSARRREYLCLGSIYV